MAWNDGVDRATGYLVTASNWNDLLGATGSLMFLKTHAHNPATAGDGSGSLGPLTLADFTTAAAPAAPGAGKGRFYTVTGDRPGFRSGAAGAAETLATLQTAQTWTAAQTFDAWQRQRGTQPAYYWQDTDGGVDQKIWRLLVDNTEMVLQALNDAETATTDPLRIVRSGMTMADILWRSDIHRWRTSGGASDLLHLNSTRLLMTSFPWVEHADWWTKFKETDGPADEKFWDLVGSAGDLILRAINDAEAASSDVMRVKRTGTTIDRVTLHGLNMPTGEGTLGQVLNSGGAAAVSTWSDPIVKRAGGNSTEATTTSVVSVDLITATVSIAAGKHAQVRYGFRKTAGAAASLLVGLKLNATQVVTNVAATTAADQAESGYGMVEMLYGLTNYLRAGMFRTMSYVGAATQVNTGFDANMPTATLTSVIITAQVGSALITGAVDELQVYELANA